MKNLFKRPAIICLAIAALIFSGCEKKQAEEINQQEKLMAQCVKEGQMSGGGTSVSTVSPYSVRLASVKKVDGGYEWIWEIQNFHPGNGTNGTVQDLSHWDLDLGDCVKLDDINNASYSKDGNNWTKFNPSFKVDKSQDCYKKNILKFDFGTTGSKISYYKLVISKNVTRENVAAVYKSGSKTGCGIFETCGFGCPVKSDSVVKLRTACDFTILAKSGISTTGTTSITGDIGVSPISSTAITGFGLVLAPGGQFSLTPIVTGNVYASDYSPPTPAKMTQAITDMETAFTTLNNLVAPPTNVNLFAGDISGKTLSAGTYKWTTGLLISDAGVTLNGGPNDIFVLQVAGNLTVNNNATINLTGGAQAKNIFWVVSGQANLGTNVDFKGTILSKTLISLNSGAKVIGRLLAQTAVTLISSTIIQTPCSK